MANTVNLGKGIMEVYDFGAVKLHAYKTNDLITDECFLVEKDKEAFLIESPCFFDNIAELEKYIKNLGVDYKGTVIAYHGAGASHDGAVRGAERRRRRRTCEPGSTRRRARRARRG